MTAAGPPLFADVLELGAKYGLEFGEPECCRTSSAGTG